MGLKDALKDAFAYLSDRIVPDADEAPRVRKPDRGISYGEVTVFSVPSSGIFPVQVNVYENRNADESHFGEYCVAVRGVKGELIATLYFDRDEIDNFRRGLDHPGADV
jgi:hypothetical protein